jgi:S-adenosyl-L-methionine hydrolase (adenosine-forming)
VAALPIAFLSDYGYDDEFAGVCRAVIAGIAPDAPVNDLTHAIRRHAVAEGAAVLARSMPYTPPGVLLAVVDPGVGSERRGVAVRAAGSDRFLVGPDNGLLAPALDALGGASEAVDLSLSPVRLHPVSATFHGRDIFAPVAAHLAAGTPLGELGEAIDPGSLAPSPLPSPQIVPSGVLAHVVAIDGFGNATLDFRGERASETGLRPGRPVEVVAGGVVREVPFAVAFSDVAPGGLILYEDSYASLALAVNLGSAAADLGLAVGDEVTLRPA